MRSRNGMQSRASHCRPSRNGMRLFFDHIPTPLHACSCNGVRLFLFCAQCHARAEYRQAPNGNAAWRQTDRLFDGLPQVACYTTVTILEPSSLWQDACNGCGAWYLNKGVPGPGQAPAGTTTGNPCEDPRPAHESFSDLFRSSVSYRLIAASWVFEGRAGVANTPPRGAAPAGLGTPPAGAARSTLRTAAPTAAATRSFRPPARCGCCCWWW